MRKKENKHSSGKTTLGGGRKEQLLVIYKTFGHKEFTKIEYDAMPGKTVELAKLWSSGHILRTRNGDCVLKECGHRYPRNTYRINPNLLGALADVSV